MNEHDLAPGEINKICEKESPDGFRDVKDHGQLVVAARATASKPARAAALGVIVDDLYRDDATMQLVRNKQ